MLPRYKPDFEATVRRFEAFWNRDVLDRPCVVVTAPKDDVDRRVAVPYRAGTDGSFLEALEAYDEWAEGTYFAGESLPSFDISLGPDQFAAFLGAELSETPAGQTNWAKPCLDTLETGDLRLDERNPVWQKVLEFYRVAAEFARDRFLLNMLDLHSNLDCLSAMRGSQTLCMDLLTSPDSVMRLLNQARRLYPVIYKAVYEAGDMAARGAIGWAPFYCRGRFAVIQCDFICMIGPDDARKLAIPALAEEAAFLDHTVLHLDGPGALKHLDDLLAIKEIDVIQWVPGDGKPVTLEWMEVLRQIQAAGKGLWIHDCSPERIKQYHRQLDPAGLLYSLTVPSMKEADDLILWLAKNT
jgi:hypothetical protein